MTIPWLVVSVHDVAPATKGETEGWLDELDRLGIPATLLVVPGPWRTPALEDAPAFGIWLKGLQSRHEVAQHGWDHTATGEGGVARRAAGSLMARGCAEFFALGELEAGRRLILGRAALAAAGITPTGFVAPGWLASGSAVRAMATLGYTYTTTHTGVIDLARGHHYWAPALSHRPGGALEGVGARVMVEAARRLSAFRRPVRIALHPDDIGRPALRAAARTAIASALDAGLRARTYADVVEERAEVAA